MANFKTHYQVAIIASATLSATFLAMDTISPTQAIQTFLLGSFSGLIPDVDSPHSTSISVAFRLFSFFLAILLVLAKAQTYSLIEMLAAVLLLYGFMQIIVINLFRKLTKHRGLFHSAPACLLYGLSIILFSTHILHVDSFTAWLFGFFGSFGYFVHLFLDEAYSVDLSNQRIKKSFGTALKLFSFQNNIAIIGSLMLYLFLAISFYVAPNPEPFLNTFFTHKTWEQFLTALMPY